MSKITFYITFSELLQNLQALFLAVHSECCENLFYIDQIVYSNDFYLKKNLCPHTSGQLQHSQFMHVHMNSDVTRPHSTRFVKDSEEHYQALCKIVDLERSRSSLNLRIGTLKRRGFDTSSKQTTYNALVEEIYFNKFNLKISPSKSGYTCLFRNNLRHGQEGRDAFGHPYTPTNVSEQKGNSSENNNIYYIAAAVNPLLTSFTESIYWWFCSFFEDRPNALSLSQNVLYSIELYSNPWYSRLWGFFDFIFFAVLLYLVYGYLQELAEEDGIPEYKFFIFFLLFCSITIFKSSSIFEMFIFIELIGFTTYGFLLMRRNREAALAGMKYYLFSIVASAFMLIALFFFYVSFGTLDLYLISFLANSGSYTGRNILPNLRFSHYYPVTLRQGNYIENEIHVISWRFYKLAHQAQLVGTHHNPNIFEELATLAFMTSLNLKSFTDSNNFCNQPISNELSNSLFSVLFQAPQRAYMHSINHPIDGIDFYDNEPYGKGFCIIGGRSEALRTNNPSLPSFFKFLINQQTNGLMDFTSGFSWVYDFAANMTNFVACLVFDSIATTLNLAYPFKHGKTGLSLGSLISTASVFARKIYSFFVFGTWAEQAAIDCIYTQLSRRNLMGIITGKDFFDGLHHFTQNFSEDYTKRRLYLSRGFILQKYNALNVHLLNSWGSFAKLQSCFGLYSENTGESFIPLNLKNLRLLYSTFVDYIFNYYPVNSFKSDLKIEFATKNIFNQVNNGKELLNHKYFNYYNNQPDSSFGGDTSTIYTKNRIEKFTNTYETFNAFFYQDVEQNILSAIETLLNNNPSNGSLNFNFNINSLKAVTPLISKTAVDGTTVEYLPFLSKVSYINFRDIFFSRKYFSEINDFWAVDGLTKFWSAYYRQDYILLMAIILNMLEPAKMKDLGIFPQDVNLRTFKGDTKRLFEKELISLDKYYNYVFRNHLVMSEEPQVYNVIEKLEKAPSVLSFALLVTSPFSFLSKIFYTNPEQVECTKVHGGSWFKEVSVWCIPENLLNVAKHYHEQYLNAQDLFLNFGPSFLNDFSIINLQSSFIGLPLHAFFFQKFIKASPISEASFLFRFNFSSDYLLAFEKNNKSLAKKPETFFDDDGLITPFNFGLYKEKLSRLDDVKIFSNIWMKEFQNLLSYQTFNTFESIFNEASSKTVSRYNETFPHYCPNNFCSCDNTLFGGSFNTALSSFYKPFISLYKGYNVMLATEDIDNGDNPYGDNHLYSTLLNIYSEYRAYPLFVKIKGFLDYRDMLFDVNSRVLEFSKLKNLNYFSTTKSRSFEAFMKYSYFSNNNPLEIKKFASNTFLLFLLNVCNTHSLHRFVLEDINTLFIKKLICYNLNIFMNNKIMPFTSRDFYVIDDFENCSTENLRKFLRGFKFFFTKEHYYDFAFKRDFYKLAAVLSELQKSDTENYELVKKILLNPESYHIHNVYASPKLAFFDKNVFVNYATFASNLEFDFIKRFSNQSVFSKPIVWDGLRRAKHMVDFNNEVKPIIERDILYDFENDEYFPSKETIGIAVSMFDDLQFKEVNTPFSNDELFNNAKASYAVGPFVEYVDDAFAQNFALKQGPLNTGKLFGIIPDGHFSLYKYYEADFRDIFNVVLSSNFSTKFWYYTLDNNFIFLNEHILKRNKKLREIIDASSKLFFLINKSHNGLFIEDFFHFIENNKIPVYSNSNTNASISLYCGTKKGFSNPLIAPFLVYDRNGIFYDDLTRSFFKKLTCLNNIQNVYSLNESSVDQTAPLFWGSDPNNIQIPRFLFNSLKAFDWVNSWVFFTLKTLENFIPDKKDLDKAYKLLKSPIHQSIALENESFEESFKETFLDSPWWSLGKKCKPDDVGTPIDPEDPSEVYWVNTLPESPEYSNGLGVRVFERGALTPYKAIMGGLAFEDSFKDRPYTSYDAESLFQEDDYDYISGNFDTIEEEELALGIRGDDFMDNFADIDDIGPFDNPHVTSNEGLIPTMPNREFMEENLGLRSSSVMQGSYNNGGFFQFMDNYEGFISPIMPKIGRAVYALDNLGINHGGDAMNSMDFEGDDDADIELSIDDRIEYDELIGLLSDDLNQDEPFMWMNFEDFLEDMTDVSNARMLDYLFADPAGLIPTGYFYEVLFRGLKEPYNAVVSEPLKAFHENMPSPIMHKYLAKKFLTNVYENNKVFSRLPVFGAVLYEYAIRDSLANNSPAQYIIDHAGKHPNFIEFRGKANIGFSNIKNMPIELKHFFFDSSAQSSLNYSLDSTCNLEFFLNLKYKKKGMYSLLPNIGSYISNNLLYSQFTSSYFFTYAFFFVKNIFTNTNFSDFLAIYSKNAWYSFIKEPQKGFYTKYIGLLNKTYNPSLYLKHDTLNSLVKFYFSDGANRFFSQSNTNNFYNFCLEGSVSFSTKIFSSLNLTTDCTNNLDYFGNFSSVYEVLCFLLSGFCDFLIKVYNIVCIKGLYGVVNTVSYKINYLNYRLPYSKHFDSFTFKFFEHPFSFNNFKNVFNYGFDQDNLGFTGSLAFNEDNSNLVDFCILTPYTDSLGSYSANREFFTSLGFLLISLYESSVFDSTFGDRLDGLLKYCKIDLSQIPKRDLVNEYFPSDNSRVKCVTLPSTGEQLFIFYKTDEPIIFDKEYEILLKLEGIPQCDINAIRDCVLYDENWFFSLVGQLVTENFEISIIAKEDYNLFVYGLIFNFEKLVNAFQSLRIEINPLNIWYKFFTEYSLSLFYNLLKNTSNNDYGSYKFLHEYFVSLVKINFGFLYKANFIDSFLNITPDSKSILFNDFNETFIYLLAHEIFKFILFLVGYTNDYSPAITVKDIVICFDNYVLGYKISPYNVIAMLDSMIYQFKAFRVSCSFFDNPEHLVSQISLKDSPMLLNFVYFIFEKIFFNQKAQFFDFKLLLDNMFTVELELAFNSISVWGIVLCGFVTDPGSWGNLPKSASVPPILPKYHPESVPGDTNYKSIYKRIKSYSLLYEKGLIFTKDVPNLHKNSPNVVPYNLHYFQQLGRIYASIIRVFESYGEILNPLSIKKSSNKAYSFAFSKIFMRQVFQAMVFYHKPMHLHSRFESFLLDYKIEMLGKNSLYPVLHFKHSHFIPGLPSYNYPGYFAFFAYHFLEYSDGSPLAETLVDISKKDLFGISTFLQPQLLDDEFYFHFIQDFDEWFFSGRASGQGELDNLAKLNRRGERTDLTFEYAKSLNMEFRASRLKSHLSQKVFPDNSPYDYLGDQEAEDPFFDALLNSFAVEEFIALESKAKGLRFLFYKYYDYFFRKKYFGNSCETSLAAGRLHNAKKKYLNILISGLNVNTQDMQKSHGSYKHTELLSFLPPKENDANFAVNDQFFQIYSFIFLPSLGDISNFIVNILGVKSPYTFYAHFLDGLYPNALPVTYVIPKEFLFKLSYADFKCSRFEKFLYTVVGITVFDVKHYLAFEPIIFSRHAFNISTVSTLNFKPADPNLPFEKNSVFSNWLGTGAFTDQISLYYFRREYAFQRFVGYLQAQLLDAEATNPALQRELFTPQKIDNFEDTIFLPQEFFYPIVNRIRRKAPYNVLTKFWFSDFVPEYFRGSRKDPLAKFLDSLSGEPLLICFRMQLMNKPIDFMNTCLKLTPVLGTFYKSKKFEPIFYGFYNFMFNGYMPNVSGHNAIGSEEDDDTDYFLSLIAPNTPSETPKRKQRPLSGSVIFSQYGVEGFWNIDPYHLDRRALRYLMKEDGLSSEFLFKGFQPLFNYPAISFDELTGLQKFKNYDNNSEPVKEFLTYDYSEILKPLVNNLLANILLDDLQKEALLNKANMFCQYWSKRLLEVARLTQTPPAMSVADDHVGMFLQRMLRTIRVLEPQPDVLEDEASALNMLKGIISNEIMFRSRRVSLLTDFSQNYTLFLAHWLMHYRSVLDTPLFFFAYGKPYHQSHKLCYLDLMHYLPTVTYAECPGVPQDLFFYCLLELDEILRKEDSRFHLYINYFEHYCKTSRPNIIKELTQKENSYFWLKHKSYFCTFFENAINNLLGNPENKDRIIGTLYTNPDTAIYADICGVPAYTHHVVAYTEFYNSLEVLNKFELGYYISALFLAPELVHYNMFFFCGCKICRFTHSREFFRHLLVETYLLGSTSTKLPGCLVYLGSNTKLTTMAITSYSSGYPHINVQLADSEFFGKVFCVCPWSHTTDYYGYFTTNFYAGIRESLAKGKVPTYFTPIDFENFKLNCFYHNIYFRNCLLEFDLVMLHTITNRK